MLPDVTYADYVAWGGGAKETSFRASLRAAETAVREVMGYNVPEASTEASYRAAVCAAVDVDVAYGGSGGIGERARSLSVGSFSTTLPDGEVSAYDLDMSRAITRELAGTGLMYQGLG